MDRPISLLAVFAYGFIFVVGALVLAAVMLFAIDITQTTHAIRRNFPVIGRFRYFFEHLGEFFRQYFFALDREAMPFNRAKRSWVYCACTQTDNTIAFGSTRDLKRVGTAIFLNDPTGECGLSPRSSRGWRGAAVGALSAEGRVPGRLSR